MSYVFKEIGVEFVLISWSSLTINTCWWYSSAYLSFGYLYSVDYNTVQPGTSCSVLGILGGVFITQSVSGCNTFIPYDFFIIYN